MTKLSWPTVGLIGVLGAIVVALATLAHWDATGIAAVLGILVGVGGGAAVVGTVSGKVEEVHAETTAQTRTLEKIDHQTNGQLAARDARIADLEAQLRRLGGQP